MNEIKTETTGLTSDQDDDNECTRHLNWSLFKCERYTNLMRAILQRVGHRLWLHISLKTFTTKPKKISHMKFPVEERGHYFHMNEQLCEPEATHCAALPTASVGEFD